MLERIQKIISHAGITSRRKAEELIAQGRVTVNGRIAKIGESADADKDKILVEGKEIQKVKSEDFVYLLMNKPIGYLSTVSDDRSRKTVIDLLDIKERVYPVGRLDLDVAGMLILTNDGEFANSVMHPRYEVKKVYEAVVNRAFSREDKARAEKGLVLEDGPVEDIKLSIVKPTTIFISIHEGRKHIVKRIFEKLGYKILHLKRIAIGELWLGELKPGKYRFLRKDELELLRK